MKGLQIYFLLLLGVAVFEYVRAHVALTFPRARKYDLDFLDNARTPGPCGMPRGDIRTSFLSGSSFNITWHLAYPHRGGFKLQILDALDRPLIDLTPVTAQSEFVEDDATAQSFPVSLPDNFTCKECTIRLLREAEEWGSAYRFWSCADIDILERKVFREDCSKHGKYLLGRCRCDRFYHGARCQFKEECLDDSDCGTQGVCVDTKATTAPRKQCYCNIGWFGPGCNKKSPVKSVDIDFDAYTSKNLSDSFKLYWRILKDSKELEAVMVVNGTSWVGLGWRPNTLTPACRAFPELRDLPGEPLPKPEPKSEPEPEASAEPIGKAEPEPHAESKAEPTSEPNSQAEPKAEPKSEPEPTTEPEPGAEPTSEPEPSAEPVSKPEPGTAEPEPSKSGAKRRSPKAYGSGVTPPDDDVMVQTSVTYQVSTKQGRRKRATEEAAPEPTGEPSGAATQIIPEPEPKISTPNPEPGSESAKNMTLTRQSISNGEPRAKSNPEPHAEPKSEPVSEPTAEPKSEPSAEPKSEPSAEPKSKPSAEPKSEPKSEPNAEPKSEPNAEPKSEPNAEPKSEPNAEPKSEPNAEPKSEPVSEPSAEPNPEPNDSPYPVPESEPKAEPSSNGDVEPITKSGATKAPTASPTHKYTPKHDFNPMDCTDIVIGSARGMTHRIGDYYTRDRSTPRPDSFWGGSDGLTAAMGFEKDGITTIAFRRKLETNEMSDHRIVDAAMHVIWAKGQEPGKFVHDPPSGIEKSKASVKNFYKPDELKYHGHHSQRGVSSLNFFDENKKESGGHIPLEGGVCGGEWRYPRHCSLENGTCEYAARWVYKAKKDELAFTVVTSNTDTWTGIGFSDDMSMSQTDAILGWVDKGTGRAFMMDTWINGYQPPMLDSSQDVGNTSGSIQDGFTTLNFSRKRVTKDNKDISITDDHCVYMMFPVKGGEFNAVNKKIKKHAIVPLISSDRICIRSCGDEVDEDAPTTPAPPRFIYDFEVKLTNLGAGFQAPEPNTPEFETISNTIADSFGPSLSKVPGYYGVKLNELERTNAESVVAKMNLILDKNESKGRALRPEDTEAMARGALKETLSTGQVGSLRVDPQYLVFKSPQINDITDEDGDSGPSATGIFLSSTKLYIVVGCVAALVALALLQATCTLYRSRKRTSKDQLITTNNAWKDYNSGANTNFAFEAFETEEKAPPPVSSLPRPREATAIGQESRNPHQQQIGGPRATYSLPRAPGPRQPPPPQPGYYTQDRRNQRYKGPNASGPQQPDFYFMPSQRKYSGEVVRVYVDYGNQPK
ncbi:uncharacterized protein LOC105690351 isoform X2 [Athalia rosae]|uniref:uncharacterized protein LOC105690351 isoform X2 n=1 Tax=Athalia rosae TaxID=37344 RepID=UPI002033C0E8|nr:uncharacterized protein LOC105690351 isoform X2 [Athalia rosae]